MHRPNPETLAFLAPGLAHQFGNLLLTIQGHAVHLDTPAVVGRAQEAILAAATRGGDSLRLLRHLLGEPGSDVGDAAVLGTQVGELLRVPVREAGFTFEMRAGAGCGAMPVEIGDFAPLLVEGVRALIAVIPDGARGEIVGSVAPLAREAQVQIAFRRAAASLPFPLDTGAAAQRVTTAAARCAWRGRCRATAHGLELAVGLAGAVTEA